jgi:hypothetical protein
MLLTVAAALALPISTSPAAPTTPPARALPRSPLSANGPIYNEDIEANLPPGLMGSDRASVEYVMRKLPPAKRRFIRWVGSGDALVVFLAYPPGDDNTAYADILRSLDSNVYYMPSTGSLFPTPGDEPPPPDPVSLISIPPAWHRYPYAHAPRYPAPLPDADVPSYLPPGLSRNEAWDIQEAIQLASSPQSRRWIRWTRAASSAPHAPNPVFDFVVYKDDPFNRDGDRVCFPNLALGVRTDQFYCPYYHEVLVDPAPRTVRRARR